MKFSATIKILFIICIIINSNRVHLTSGSKEYLNSTETINQKHRLKRQLAFQPGTRIMFRVNTKDNIIKINQIYAHGFGFRGNIDLTQPNRPELLPSEQELHHNRKRRSLKRREVFETLEELINQHGFDGRSCILKMTCDAQEIGPDDGMLYKIFKLIFTHKQSPSGTSRSEIDADYPMMNADDCQKLKRSCPLHLLDISPYTDI